MKAEICVKLKCPMKLICSAIYPLLLGYQVNSILPADEGNISESVEQKVLDLVEDSAVSIESHMRSLRQLDFAHDPVKQEYRYNTTEIRAGNQWS